MLSGGKNAAAALQDYVICIPSYGRAQLCNDKTLSTLHRHGIRCCSSRHDGQGVAAIHVYVANEAELSLYEKTLDRDMYSQLTVGTIGLVAQRRFIAQQFPEGQHIVFMDDDIAEIDLSISERFKNGSLDAFFRAAFQDAAECGAYLWGVYPVYNHYFMKPAPESATCLNFVVGALYGTINRANLAAIEIKIAANMRDQKEDVERSIKHFLHDGCVLRYNHVGFKTKYYGTSGGLGTFKDRVEDNKRVALRLKELYPSLGSIYTRKNGMTEFRLRKIPRVHYT